MSLRFEALDEYFWGVNNDPDSEAPDEAFDWIFMMKPEDWSLLQSAWQERPPGWRQECAYVLGHGPIKECRPFLEMAIFDLEFEVATQAAESLAGLLLDSKTPNVGFSASVRERLALLRDLSRSPENSELFRILAGA